MKITHIATSALLVSIFSLGSVANAGIDNDFKLCATKAMSDQNLFTKSIKVQNGSSSSEDLNHSFSQNLREYKMKIVTKAGKNMGYITCTFNKDQLESSTFVSKI